MATEEQRKHRNEYAREYRKKFPEKVRATQRRSYAKKKDYYKMKRHLDYERTKEAILEKQRNDPKRKAYMEEYRKTEAYRESKRKSDKKYYEKNKYKFKIYWSKLLYFKGKKIHVSEIVRDGICKKCKRSALRDEIQKTNIHHRLYHKTDPIKYTIELCVRCHKIEDLKIQYNPLYRIYNYILTRIEWDLIKPLTKIL